jgi:hypothetical protein
MPFNPCGQGQVGIFNPETRGWDCSGIEPPVPPLRPPGTGTGQRVVQPLGEPVSGDWFTDAILAIVGAGIGNIVAGSGGSAIGSIVGNTLTSTLKTGGLPTGAIPGAVLQSIFPYGITETPAIHYTPAPAVQASQPFDPGGLGGGALTLGPYLQATGKLVGGLLKSKRIKVGQLLTGGNVAAIAQLVERELN